jgi:hypothetical protein
MTDIRGDDGGGRERVMDVNLPSNSQKSKQGPAPKAKQEKIVTGNVTQRRRGLGGQVLSSFLTEDSQTVFQYVVLEVLLPAAKNMVSDAFSQGVDRFLFGENRTRNSARQGYTNYSRPAVAGGRIIPADPRPQLSRQARATHDFDGIVVETRAEAEEVIDKLRLCIDEYNVATVNDLYDLVGLTGEFTDDKWGWYDLKAAAVRPTRNGYLLNLPRTQPIA